MSDKDGESRSERLRKRRESRANQKLNEKTQIHEPDKPSKPSQPDETSERLNQLPSPPTSVKDEQTGTYMYLPESQKKEIDRLYNILKADYEYEFEVAFEKNRHYFPLLIQFGLEGLDGLDVLELRDRLDGLC